VGEALSCLLVGLQRWHRGERLSAARFVQGHALDRLLELDALRHPAAAAGADPFNRERRLEARCPSLAAELPALVPGYGHTPQAALAMLQALAQRGAMLAPAITERIRTLAQT
jgi:lincosamide nucleotidyltransferase